MSTATEITQATQRARRLYNARGFRTAYINGARAALAGKTAGECPYRHDPNKTWRAAYRNAWILGWQSVGAGLDLG